MNFAKIEGQILTQVSFGLNYVLLQFENSSIQFSGPFIINVNGQESAYDEVYPVKSDYGLLNFLEKSVEGVSCNEERTCLFIQFSEEASLHLLSSAYYESFELYLDGKRTII